MRAYLIEKRRGLSSLTTPTALCNGNVFDFAEFYMSEEVLEEVFGSSSECVSCVSASRVQPPEKSGYSQSRSCGTFRETLAVRMVVSGAQSDLPPPICSWGEAIRGEWHPESLSENPTAL